MDVCDGAHWTFVMNTNQAAGLTTKSTTGAGRLQLGVVGVIGIFQQQSFGDTVNSSAVIDLPISPT
jgi:hypothetical protein